MKNYIQYIALLVICLLCGCSSTVPLEDTSYETELFGTYGTDYKIQINEDYTLSCSDTNGDMSESYVSEFETTKINDDILEITYTDNFGDKRNLFKYKNILGSYHKTEETIPKSKHFNIGIHSSFDDYEGDSNQGWVFTKDGLFHNCDDINNCTCNEEKTFFLPYERKDSVIYVNATSEKTEAYWQVLFYVVDDGLFTPSWYKVEE